VRVLSEIAEPTQISLDEAKAQGPLRFVFGAIEMMKAKLPHGFDIEIRSQINPNLGLGSSAAVTTAMFAGLQQFTDDAEINARDIHCQALALVRKIQNRGSGADLAASAFGGMVHYQLGDDDQPKTIAPLSFNLPLGLCYAGYKTPTAQVLRMVAEAMQKEPQKYKDIYARMGGVAQGTIDAAQQMDWSNFHQLINQYQSLMQELGVSDQKLEELIRTALNDPSVESAKISGSGLGDCVVAIGGCPPSFTKAELARDGVRIEAMNEQ
jgi:mevalonate kinase